MLSQEAWAGYQTQIIWHMPNLQLGHQDQSAQLTKVFAESIQGVASLLLHLRRGVVHDVKDAGQQLLVVLVDVWLAVLCQLPQGKGRLPPDQGFRVLETSDYHLKKKKQTNSTRFSQPTCLIACAIRGDDTSCMLVLVIVC